MIAVANIKKRYGSLVALKGISFRIAEGECYGLLGPNGAGKTTVISILSTLLEADEGHVQIAGLDPGKNPIECKKVIGVVPQEIALYNDLSALENLMFWGSLYSISKNELNSRIGEILQLFGLYERRKDKIKTYSGGMKRRINIASALLHRPRVLFMDEPTVGIDPQSRNLIFEVVEKLHREKLTIIYTTHYMEEAERLCDRIGIIDNGSIIAQGSLDELRASSSLKETLIVHCDALPNGRADNLKTLRKELTVSGNDLFLPTENAKTDLPEIILQCNEMNLDITGIEIKKVNLETIFLNLTGKQLRD